MSVSLDPETRSLVALLDLLEDWTGGNIPSRGKVADAIRVAAEAYAKVSGYRSAHEGPLFRGTALPTDTYLALKDGRPAVLRPTTTIQSWSSSRIQAEYFAAESNEDRPAAVLAMPADRLTVLVGLDELYRRLPAELRDRYSSFRAGDGVHDENEFIVVARPIHLDGDNVLRLLDDPWEEGYYQDEAGIDAPSP